MIDKTETAAAERLITAEQLAGLGGGKIAYVKTMQSDEINRLFPEAPDLTPGVELFALLGADGSPIVLTDSREAAIANAWENELETVSLH
jgi:hypothetical protein